MKYALIEKANHLAIHGIFSSKERADRHLLEVVPEYVRKSYFMDKSLTAESFEIVEYVFCKRSQRAGGA